MARLRSVKAVRVLTFEEKTRVANLFTLLIEVNLEKGVTRKRRASQSTKNKKTQQCCKRKTKHKPTSPRLRRPRPMQPCHIVCINNTASRTCKFPVRDLFLQSFTRIFRNIINFTMGYCNDRYHRFNNSPRIIYYYRS
jgi:hypothetical protein